MWTRRELKERGKTSFKKFYLGAVVACMLLGFVSFIIQDHRDDESYVSNNIYEQYEREDGSLDFEKMSVDASSNVGLSVIYKAIKTPSFIIFAILLSLAKYLIINPLHVGINHYFMRNRDEPTRFGAVFYGFKGSRYFHVCYVMFLRDLFTSLWALLFIIPGIIKSYEYRMIPYILAENSDLSSSRVFALTKAMMKDNKLDTFVLDVSFFFWIFAVPFTFGLLGLFYVDPYMQATEAELYAVLRNNVLTNGEAEVFELQGFYAS